MLMRAVKDAGYTPIVEKVTIPISGISCATCVATIEEALRRSPGVVSATVNFATNAATVEFAPVAATVADLRRTIREAGYEPLEAAEGSALADHEKTAREREIRALKRKLAVGIVLSVPIVLGSMHHWFPWVPEILQNFWALWALTTPVQFWVGGAVLSRGLGRPQTPNLGHEHSDRRGHLGGLLLQPGNDDCPRLLSGSRHHPRRPLRDGGRDHHPDPTGPPPGGDRQGADVRGDQAAHGPAAQDGSRRPGR